MEQTGSEPDPRRALPSVDELLRQPELARALAERPRPAVVAAARAVLAAARRRLGDGAAARLPAPAPAELALAALRELERRGRAGLARAINATGVVLHTGLGRAPLAAAAQRALAEVARGYSVLELERTSGRRGVREQAAARLLCELSGAEAATVVNNNAAACLLMLRALCAGREVVVARGQLVEIGGSFRMPEVMAESGARLVEVGATNRVRLEDYAAAIGPQTAAVLRVHTSNYRIVGFASEVALAELAPLCRERGVLLLEDLGSGNLLDLQALGLPRPEPQVTASVRAGADVVCFSGDKLLGGPQAGLLVGRAPLIAALRRHPLFRALRPDKLQLAALEATLRLHAQGAATAAAQLPALRLLAEPQAAVRRRAEALARALADTPGLELEVVATEAQAGSGALPAVPIPSAALACRHRALSAEALARRLRLGEPPVFARVHRGARGAGPADGAAGRRASAGRGPARGQRGRGRPARVLTSLRPGGYHRRSGRGRGAGGGRTPWRKTTGWSPGG
ncbi:MAG: hypothetical protein KatS3mg102_1512 [Planctomycetota bacterium]|nr:MAG: hypothetical protein KatS3mg102_1512 [Planctomycetota bacterium]